MSGFLNNVDLTPNALEIHRAERLKAGLAVTDLTCTNFTEVGLLFPEEALVDLLSKKRRTLKRSMNLPPASAGALVQVVLMKSGEALVSIISAAERNTFRHVLAPLPGGMMTIKADKHPPSRAYLKLREALCRAELKINSGSSVVDLGAAPGGWTYDAVFAGAKVTAVDKTDLDPDLMSSPRVTMKRESAFNFHPGAKVDWMLCDVIAFPHRTFALLKRWREEKMAKQFCVTLKFKGMPDLELLREVKEFLHIHASRSFLTQLAHNKNEVTVCGIFD